MRKREVDLMRGVAVLAMVLIHCQQIFAMKSETRGVWGHLIKFLGGAPAAPTFLFLMGLLIGWRAVPSWFEVGRRALQLAALGMGLNFLRAWLPIQLGAPLAGEASSLLWMIDILQLAAPALLILRGLQDWPTVPIVFLTFLLPWIAPIVWPFFPSPSPFDFIAGNGAAVFFPLMPWFSLPLWGLATSRLGRTARLRHFAAGLALWLIGRGLAEVLPGSSYYHPAPGQVWAHLGFVWVWWFVAVKMASFVGPILERFFRFWSERVTSAYVFSWLWISYGSFIFGYRERTLSQTLLISLVVGGLTALSCEGWHRWRAFDRR